MESDAFFDLADEQGILVMAGWTCCDYWQKWTDWKQSDIEIATASLRSQIARLRSHPSMLAWLNGSDQPPPAMVERPFLTVAQGSRLAESGSFVRVGKYHAAHRKHGRENARPVRLHAARLLARGHIGKFGGAYGFATEISPGAAIPPLFEPARKCCPRITSSRTIRCGIITPAPSASAT